MKLLFNALSKLLCGIVFIGLLLFLPAGSFSYTNGIIFIGLLFIPIFILGTILFIKSPALLEKRLRTKEREPFQHCIVMVSALLFAAGFAVSGLDYRLGWSYVPLWMQIAGSVVFLASFAIYAEVMRENKYLSRTVEVQKDQHVVDSGLYSIIRHPMYFATIIMFISVPVILASWWAYIFFTPYAAVIAARIKNEEKLLEKELRGYSEYKEKVKYRLIPFIW